MSDKKKFSPYNEPKPPFQRVFKFPAPKRKFIKPDEMYLYVIPKVFARVSNEEVSTEESSPLNLSEYKTININNPETKTIKPDFIITEDLVKNLHPNTANIDKSS